MQWAKLMIASQRFATSLLSSIGARIRKTHFIVIKFDNGWPLLM